MTFKDEIEKYKRMSYEPYGLYAIYDNKDIYELLQKLQEEYAPTVKMTKEEYKVFLKYRNKKQADYSELLDAVIGSYFESEEHGLFPELTRNTLMQVWLHPETIEPVEE